MTYPCVMQDDDNRKWFVAGATGPITWTYHETKLQAEAEMDRLNRYASTVSEDRLLVLRTILQYAEAETDYRRHIVALAGAEIDRLCA